MPIHSSPTRCAPSTSRNPLPRPCDSPLLWYDARMDTPHILRPHLELGDICRVTDTSNMFGDPLPTGFGLVIGGVEGQVVDLLIEGRLIKLNRRWLEPLAREHVRPAGGVV